MSLLRRRAMYKAGELPAGYKRCEYIEGTGTQFIDLGSIPIGEKSGFRIRLNITSGTGGNAFGGCVPNTRNFSYFGLRGGSASFYTSNYSSSGYKPVAGFGKILYGTDIEYAYKYDNVRSLFSIQTNGIEIGTSRTFTMPNSSYALFSFKDANGIIRRAADEVAKMKLMLFEVFSGENIQAELLPCIRLEGQSAGMYDIVSDTFFGNVGTGSFVAGNKV